MIAKLEGNSRKYKGDLINLLILISIAAIIGIYLIITTVLISKDGVFYIEAAQQFANDPMQIAKTQLPGHPFLIFLAHKFVSFFTDSTSNQIWIYSAQGVTLFCRLLALITLYFIGKLLVGNKNSFWAVLILIFLPDSAEYGSGSLTEWPHMMFLAIGFLMLLSGAKYHKSWMFGLSGVIAALAYLVRSEGCQLILYGSAWLVFNLLRPKEKMKRTQAAGALILHLIGFSVIAFPYMRFSGYVFPDQGIWKLPEFLSFSHDSYGQIINANTCLAGLSIKGLIGDETLVTNISETLMYYFLPALLIGAYYYFRKQSKLLWQTFFAAAFIIFNIAMLVWQSNRFLSRRHTLALVVFTIFYIPIGLRIIACWLSGKNTNNNLSIQKDRQRWFLVLLVIGISICLPKLLRPIRINKSGYLEAARWLKKNTKPEDIISAPDRRLIFYANRINPEYLKKAMSEDVKYQVKFIADGGKNLKAPLLFNGINSIVKTNLTMQDESCITVSAWVKPGVALYNGTIFSPCKWNNDFFSIRSKDDKWYACLRWGTNTSYYLASKSPYAAGKWYQITAVADIPNQTLMLYVNGALTNSTTIDSMGKFDNAFRWNIGGTSKQYFKGSINNVMVFKEALQANEVEALYAKGGRLNKLSDVEKVIERNCILACWRIDEESSLWIEEMIKARRAEYEVLVDKQNKTGKKIAIYKLL